MSGHSDLDNHADQMNPNNDAYWQSRGEDERPDDWVERSGQDDVKLDPDSSQSSVVSQRQLYNGQPFQ